MISDPQKYYVKKFIVTKSMDLKHEINCKNPSFQNSYESAKEQSESFLGRVKGREKN